MTRTQNTSVRWQIYRGSARFLSVSARPAYAEVENNSTFTMMKTAYRCHCIPRRRVMHCRLRALDRSMVSDSGMAMSSLLRGQKRDSEGGCAHELDHPARKGFAFALGRNITASAAGRIDSYVEYELRWRTRNAQSYGTSPPLRADLDTRVV